MEITDPGSPPEKDGPDGQRRTDRDPGLRESRRLAPLAALSEDVVLHFKGSFQGHFNLDEKLPAGRGPLFSHRKTTPGKGPGRAPGPMLTIRATVAEVGGCYRVTYTLAARVSVTITQKTRPSDPVTSNIEYRDLEIEGGILVSPDTQVIICKTRGKELSLTVRQGTGTEDDGNARQP